jgi:HAD superfamily hydrolase (TIGR01509 family)
VTLQLVIFDCDGVLVDSEGIANRVLAEHVTASGIPMTPQEAGQTFQGRRWSEIVGYVEQRRGRPLPSGWWDRHDRERALAFRRELRAVPNVATALSALASAGIRCCVATQARLEKMRLTLDVTDLASSFPEWTRFSADQVARGKPEPDLFLHAADGMGCDPDCCIVIEDSRVGVVAAVRAGMRVLGYAPNDDGSVLSDHGAAVFHDMADLPGLLGVGGT